MRAVSNAWKRTVGGSYTPFTRVTLCQDFQTGSSPLGIRLPIASGRVVHDGDADVYGRLEDMAIPGSYWPENYGDTSLAPYGVEAYVQVGIKYSDDLLELLGLGYFRLQVLGQDKPETQGEIKVSGQDRMAKLIRASLLEPIFFDRTTSVGDFVEALVLPVYPEATIEYDDDVDALTIGRDILVSDSRYAPLKAVAQSFGQRVYWDHRGVLVFRVVPSPTTPVATLKGGQGGGLLASPRELNATNVVNAVIATGTGMDDVGTVRGIAVDTDPRSPTNYTDFGPAPVTINSPLLVSNTQCGAAAQAELNRSAGLPYNVSLQTSPRYELQPDDCVLVDQRSMFEPHVLSVVTFPLLPGSFQDLATRQQLVTLIGGGN